jgi:predicted nucleic acid-binding protein
VTRIVVDASVFVASLISRGPTRAILLGSQNLEFYSPEVVVEELQKQLRMVTSKAGQHEETVQALIGDVLSKVQVVPTLVFADKLPDARERASRADALGDEAYVALADVLAAPVWTYDKDSRRIRDVRVLSTADVRRLGDSTAPL